MLACVPAKFFKHVHHLNIFSKMQSNTMHEQASRRPDVTTKTTVHIWRYYWSEKVGYNILLSRRLSWCRSTSQYYIQEMCQIGLWLHSKRRLAQLRTRQGVQSHRSSRHDPDHWLWPAVQNKTIAAMRPLRRRNILSWQIQISNLQINNLRDRPLSYRLIAVTVVQQILDLELAPADIEIACILEHVCHMK